jgi:hypothetical protein
VSKNLRIAAPIVQHPVSRRFGLAALMFGAGLLLPACSRQRNDADQANRATAMPADSAKVTTAAPAASDPGVNAQIAAKRRTLVAEAVSALQETGTALELLAQGKSDDAIGALSRATGKLDIVLAADPRLALAPVDVRVATHDVIATPDAVKALRDRATVALAEGRLQDARRLITDLASEHVISVTSIPLATYPDAIKQAAALIHAGKPADAAATLEAALATLVIEDTIIPLPLARAEASLDLARPLAEKPQRTPAENDRLQGLLAAARMQIELAQALGYATKADLAALSDELKTIESKTRGKGAGKGLFDRIKALFQKANRQANVRTGS